MLDTVKDYYDLLDYLSELDEETRFRESRVLAQNDLFFLLWHLCGRDHLEHQWSLERCKEVQEKPDGYLDLWSREHGKSSLITFGKTIQDVLIDPEITIGIFSHTRPIAKSFLRQIMRELENNQRLKELFPDILYENPRKQSPKWSEDEGMLVKRKTNPAECTVEAWGLVDGMPTGRHFRLRVYDDVVTMASVTSKEQVDKTTEAWEMSDNLGVMGGISRMIGTRYCTIGSTKILMSDWSHKPISDVAIGEEVIGWSPREDGKRFLVKSRVLHIGNHKKQPVNEYTFSNGRTVVCTKDHQWWRGAHWAASGKESGISRGREYSPLGFGYHQSKQILELLEPIEDNNNYDCGWLAGFFDGEGTVRKNKYHTSGSISFTQSIKNQDVIDKFKSIMDSLNFKYSIYQSRPTGGRRFQCFHFNLLGGWREHYRFFAMVKPSRSIKIKEILFSQLKTKKHKLEKIEEMGLQDVYWLETETGNYIANGFCSKNSLFDTYATIMERGAAIPRIYAATDNGRMDGSPVLFTQTEWERRLKTQSRQTVASQLLQNPLADEDATFKIEWLKSFEVMPAVMNVAILCDPSKGLNESSDNTAMLVIGLDMQGNKYLLDGFCHHMGLNERWTRLRDLHIKWERIVAPHGRVDVGYEQYGMQSDDEYFDDAMEREKYIFIINKLSWTREGTRGEQGKRTRVERLEPDFRNGRFYLPANVWREGKGYTWRIVEGKLVWNEFVDFSKMQKSAIDAGHGDRVMKAIKRYNEERRIYDLTAKFIDEYSTFPFGRWKDAIDAASRFYDLDISIPKIIRKQDTETKTYWDS